MSSEVAKNDKARSAIDGVSNLITMRMKEAAALLEASKQAKLERESSQKEAHEGMGGGLATSMK